LIQHNTGGKRRQGAPIDRPHLFSPGRDWNPLYPTVYNTTVIKHQLLLHKRHNGNMGFLGDSAEVMNL
jgi:hypothetical protein